jgi:hypothetical protein
VKACGYDCIVSVNTETGHDSSSRLLTVWPRYRGWIPSREKRYFSSPQYSDRLWGRLSLRYSGISGVCREADHSPPSNDEVKLASNYRMAWNQLTG